MIGYILILLVILIGGVNAQEIQASPKKKKNFLLVAFGMMICFAVLRNYTVGIDYSNRVEFMERILDYNFSEVWNYVVNIRQSEYLYSLYIWLVSRFIPSPWFLNVIMDVFVLSTFGWFFYRYSKDVTITTLMFAAFVFTASLNITRQYVAAAFFLIALHFLLQKKPAKAAVPILVAFLIHNTAVLLFAIYLIYWIGFSINRKKLFGLLVASVVAFFGFDFVLDWFLARFPQYSYALREWGVGDKSFSFLWLAIYFAIFLMLFFTLPKHRDGVTDEVTGIVSVGYVLYALLAMLVSVVWFVHRVQVYFIFGYCMVIPEIFFNLRMPARSKQALSVAFKVVLALWAFWIFIDDSHGILPYEFIWQRFF